MIRVIIVKDVLWLAISVADDVMILAVSAVDPMASTYQVVGLFSEFS